MANTKLIQRSDYEQNWNLVNPILSRGEIGFVIESGLYKFGDGVKKWSQLRYPINIVQTIGYSATSLMSQDATMKELNKKASKTQVHMWAHSEINSWDDIVEFPVGTPKIIYANEDSSVEFIDAVFYVTPTNNDGASILGVFKDGLYLRTSNGMVWNPVQKITYPIVSAMGDSETSVMSQAAVTGELKRKADTNEVLSLQEIVVDSYQDLDSIRKEGIYKIGNISPSEFYGSVLEVFMFGDMDSFMQRLTLPDLSVKRRNLLDQGGSGEVEWSEWVNG